VFVTNPASGPGFCFVHSGVAVQKESAPDGAPAFRTEIRDNVLIYDSERSEWANGPSDCPNFRSAQGDTTRTRLSVYLAADFPVYQDWSLIAQWKAPHKGTPPSQIALQGEEFAIRGIGSESPRKYLSVGPVVRGRWVTFDVRHHWSPDPAVGWVEVYRDGQLVLPRTHMRTLEPDHADVPVFLSVGQYRSMSNSGTSVLWVGQVDQARAR
jgi:hypothetical protein